MARVLRCDEGDFDVVTGTCATPFWAEDTGFLPPLSASESLVIAGAIASAWALGYAIRQVRRAASRT